MLCESLTLFFLNCWVIFHCETIPQPIFSILLLEIWVVSRFSQLLIKLLRTLLYLCHHGHYSSFLSGIQIYSQEWGWFFMDRYIFCLNELVVGSIYTPISWSKSHLRLSLAYNKVFTNILVNLKSINLPNIFQLITKVTQNQTYSSRWKEDLVI